MADEVMSDGEIDVYGVQSDDKMIQSRLTEMRISATTVQNPAKQPYHFNEEEELIDYQEGDIEEKHRMFEKYRKEILLYCAPPDPLDTTGATIITVDSEELRRLDVDVPYLRIFLAQCGDRRALQVYDLLWNPLVEMFSHWERPSMDVYRVKDVTDFSLKSCRDLYKKDALRLSSVDKLSLSRGTHYFFYLTFTVADELTNEHTTFQAQIMEPFFSEQFLLGLLRDVTHDKVVAILQIEEETIKAIEGAAS